ncbi:hypothetical protein EDC15_111102 [Acetobacter aceti NBRC 14818]|nr:hypothetical protein EDC15_111102 [Acetobacter aceti NBRC 14818]
MDAPILFGGKPPGLIRQHFFCAFALYLVLAVGLHTAYCVPTTRDEMSVSLILPKLPECTEQPE